MFSAFSLQHEKQTCHIYWDLNVAITHALNSRGIAVCGRSLAPTRSLAGIYNFCLQKAELKVLMYGAWHTELCYSKCTLSIPENLMVRIALSIQTADKWPKIRTVLVKPGCLTKKSWRQSQEFGLNLWNKKKCHNQIDLEKNFSWNGILSFT